MGPDRVVVANGGRTVALSGSGFAARVVPLLAALDGTSTADELQARFPDMAPAVLAGLTAKGLLVDAGAVADGLGVAPQSAALALPGGPSPADSHARLGVATVAVVGCGPVGGEVAILLTKAGVGRLMLVDRGPSADRDIAVSPALQLSDVGVPRAEAVAHHCREVGAGAVELAADGLLGSRPDLAVVELGYDKVGTTIADQCLAEGVSYLVHTQDALRAGIGPLVGPQGHPCHRCLAARRLGHITHLDEHLAYLDRRASTSPHPDAYLAAQVALVAGLVAIEALRALLGAEARTNGALLTLDVGEPELGREVLLPVPDCPGCEGAGGGEP
jgi:bacteriocin biosynthesis cyclodehydratase domain-containing protein